MEPRLKLCRVCLEPESSKSHRPIFDDKRRNDIAAKIYFLSGVLVIECKNNPAVICDGCFKNLLQADRFRKSCLEADKHFRSNIPREFFKGMHNVEGSFRSASESWVDCLWYDNLETEVKTEKDAESDAAVKIEFPSDVVDVKLKIEPVIEKVWKKPLPMKVKRFPQPHKSPKKPARNVNSTVTRIVKSTSETYFCSICFKFFSNLICYKRHQYSRHTDIPDKNLFRCDFCGEKTKIKSQIRSHIMKFHSDKSNEKIVRKRLQCSKCARDFINKQSLSIHIYSVHTDVPDENLFKCDICGEKLKMKRPIRMHMKMHLTKLNEKNIKRKKLQCSKCPKSFLCKYYLRDHFSRVHLKRVKQEVKDLFHCDCCGKTFSTRRSISKHIRNHSKKLKYVCKVCGKQLIGVQRLQVHEKAHIVIDPSQYVTCPVCQKKFKFEEQMLKHKKLFHVKLEKVKCPHCPHISAQKNALKIHIRNIHLKIKTKKCNLCDKAYFTNLELKSHMLFHTGESPFKCIHCSKGFRISCNMRRHEKICIKEKPRKVRQVSHPASDDEDNWA